MRKAYFYTACFLLVGLFHFACQKEKVTCATCCEPIPPLNPSCDPATYRLIDPLCIDLRNYAIRTGGYYDEGYCTAKKEVPHKGAIEWKVNAVIHKDNSKGDTIQGMEFANFYDTTWVGIQDISAFDSEYLSITFKARELGKRKLVSGANRTEDYNYTNYYTLDHDIVLSSWILDETQDNYIDVQKYDAQRQIVEGEFELYFNLVEDEYNLGYSDAVRFQCGKFRAKIIQ